MLKHGILGLLNYGEMTGYEIKTVFEDSLNFFWTAQTSQIYRELQNIEKKDWAVKTVVKQSGKPDKNVYSITQKGKEELNKWLSEDASGLVMKTPLLMKVFFMGELSTEQNIKFFKDFKEHCTSFTENITSVNTDIQQYKETLNDNKKSLYWQMCASFGNKIMKTYIEWANECIENLEDLQ
ncbi:MAG: PadR family transcriptional regulator [Acutalibacteraceae bacterium]|nr:PadR family transcriptional regulator [Acutalibacteraceae bacterium]